MGQEISHSGFTAQEHAQFRTRLREETKILRRWFEGREFHYSGDSTGGMELEAWLLDGSFLPAPRNAEFLSMVDDPGVVPELSQFNFEINSDPLVLRAGYLRDTRAALADRWRRCREAAHRLEMTPLAIGILPTVRDQMLQPEWMTESNRYHALNRELARLRGLSPVHIEIHGDDELDYHCGHIMLEAACTSLQVHLKVNQDDARRYYNASLLAAAPLVAVSANSPFLYGQSLWAETRVPAFEQVTATHGFRDADGCQIGRTTLGTDYVRHSLLELFIENLSYPTLLPTLFDDPRKLPHLRLHNGTLWRWCRPLIGFEADGTPHLRIEQRVMAAGPTIDDMVANIALSQGLTLALGRDGPALEEEIGFDQVRENFHACARGGLDARVRWRGREVGVQALLLDHLIPAARLALERQDLDRDDLDYYFGEILHRRVLTGRNGACWQRSFVDLHGKDFQALTQRYAELQLSDNPVHDWSV